MTDRLRGGLRLSQEAAWALLVLTLPVTSSPPLAKWSGASTVAPLATVPLMWLIITWFVPYLLGRGRLSRLTLPFLAFLSAALLASLAAHFIEIPSFKGKSVFSQESQALLTLAIGAAFYLTAATWLRNEARFKVTLQLLNLSGFALILWSLAQAYIIWFRDARFPETIVQLQDWISVGRLFKARVTGFAYEPSWLGHQLNILYLPVWLAASLERASAHRLRLFRVTVENVLFAGGFLVLLVSFSRIGILAFLMVVTYLFLKGNLAVIGRISKWLLRRLGGPAPFRDLIRYSVSIILSALLVLAYLLALIGLVYSVSRFDERLDNLFEPELFSDMSVFAISNRLAFAERVVYWSTGWEIFNDHPFLGVGPGNAGFFFPQKMPAFGWALWEITQIFLRQTFLPNTKSMWIRILAETGLVGLAFFLTWYLVLWRSARVVAHHATGTIRRIALAGQFALIAILIEGFSIDSYALPYIWIALGLLTAVITRFHNQELPGPARQPARLQEVQTDP